MIHSCEKVAKNWHEATWDGAGVEVVAALLGVLLVA